MKQYNFGAVSPAACGGTGDLPSSAPLALAQVPFQHENGPLYDQDIAIIKGTVFQELDMPLRGQINRDKLSPTCTHRLMESRFALHDLGLYLLTHPHDSEATALYSQLLVQTEALKDNYENNIGPLKRSSKSAVNAENWLRDPWPWDYTCKEN